MTRAEKSKAWNVNYQANLTTETRIAHKRLVMGTLKSFTPAMIEDRIRKEFGAAAVA
jgi:hypothetical protein